MSHPPGVVGGVHAGGRSRARRRMVGRERRWAVGRTRAGRSWSSRRRMVGRKRCRAVGRSRAVQGGELDGPLRRVLSGCTRAAAAEPAADGGAGTSMGRRENTGGPVVVEQAADGGAGTSMGRRENTGGPVVVEQAGDGGAGTLTGRREKPGGAGWGTRRPVAPGAERGAHGRPQPSRRRMVGRERRWAVGRTRAGRSWSSRRRMVGRERRWAVGRTRAGRSWSSRRRMVGRERCRAVGRTRAVSRRRGFRTPGRPRTGPRPPMRTPRTQKGRSAGREPPDARGGPPWTPWRRPTL